MSELKVIGIDGKGYGKVYKAVMRNPCIPLTAKAIYAYFCSYAGSGTTAFPHRDKIIRDLQISKNTFTKHLGLLVEAGYIARQRTALGNVYEILAEIPDKDGGIFEAKSQGYGTIPKLAMLDERLSVESKAIYAYLCSYAGGGHVAYPHRNTILRELKIGKTSYYPHYRALIETGYLTPAQKAEENGRYTSCDYRLNEEIGVDPDKATSQKPGHGDTTETVLQSDSQKAVHGGEETASESDSQNPVHGENPTDSQNPIHGYSRTFNTVFHADSQNAVHGEDNEEVASQNPISRKSVYRNLGHPNINNSSYNKHSAISIAEDITNTRARTRTRGAGSEATFPFSRKNKVKELMGYDFLLREITAWAKIKKLLGHFPDTADISSDAAMLAYTGRGKEVLDELARQLRTVFDGHGDSVEHCGRRYDRAALRQVLEAKLTDRETLMETVTEVVERGDGIKNLRAYMQTLVFNLADAS